MTKKAQAEFDERLRKVLWDCRTWGKMEAAAGVTDRLAFWRGKTEDTARAALHEMIADRIRRGEIQ